MRAPRAIGWAIALALGLLLPLLVASNAHAYPWMIRHGYAGCAPCHTDPSGGAGALTPYGRAQGELLLRTRYGDTSDEAGALAGLGWGQIQTSDAVRLGGDVREALLSVKPDGAAPTRSLITMRADLYGDIRLHRFRLAGSIGYIPAGDRAAALTRNTNQNIISREHWLGYELDADGSWLVRGGRLTLPFGIRNIEHTLWTRSLTRTDLDATQQYGVALSGTHDRFRGEIMGVLGNFQVHPDDYRERGFSGYVEYAPTNVLALGASSLFTRATRDIRANVTNYRQAHGVFARYAPLRQLVLLAEGDLVYQSLVWNGHRGGFAAFVQADVEPTQGVHFMLTGEAMNGGSAGEPPSFGGWLSWGWFFAPHADVRADGIYQTLGTPSGSNTNVLSWLVQLHVYL